MLFGCHKISLWERVDAFCYKLMIWWWDVMLFGPLRDFLMRCHACWPWWDVMRCPHDSSCFWTPNEISFWDLMLFVAYFSEETSLWDGLFWWDFIFVWQLKDVFLMRCHAFFDPFEMSLLDLFAVCCIIVSWDFLMRCTALAVPFSCEISLCNFMLCVAQFSCKIS